jgi:hypothetical protein
VVNECSVALRARDLDPTFVATSRTRSCEENSATSSWFLMQGAQRRCLKGADSAVIGQAARQFLCLKFVRAWMSDVRREKDRSRDGAPGGPSG